MKHASGEIPVERLEVAVYTMPTDFPESDGTLRWNKTTMVLVQLLPEVRVASATPTPMRRSPL